MLLHVFAKRNELGIPEESSLAYDDLWLEGDLIEARDIVEGGIIKGKDFKSIGPKNEILKQVIVHYSWYGYELFNSKKERISKVVLVQQDKGGLREKMREVKNK